MWTHKAGTYTNCYTGTSWDKTLCPDGKTCAENCAIEAGPVAEYESTYGVAASGDALTLGFVTKQQYGVNVGSRNYLMEDTSHYKMFQLKNREFTFTADVSQLPCGLNGALYFVAMQADGGMSEYPGNTAGAAYGTGYCDAQCPHDLKFINGEANVAGWNATTGMGKYGTCCTEMDIWEANSQSTQLTPHVCNEPAGTQYRCSTPAECGDNGPTRNTGLCDKNGADWNPYRLGDTQFFGAGGDFTVDTTKPVTVVTQFVTTDGTDDGDLSEIRRFYMQDGQRINTTAWKQYDSITDDFVKAEKEFFGDAKTFESRGGLKRLGDVMDSNGMVLVMSLWDDHYAQMDWLDSQFPEGGTAPGDARGPCKNGAGDPAVVEKQYPNSKVVFSDVRHGEIGSTVPVGPGPSPGPSPSGCPGGSLSACIGLCPSNPPAAYKACVEDCTKRCA